MRSVQAKSSRVDLPDDIEEVYAYFEANGFGDAHRLVPLIVVNDPVARESGISSGAGGSTVSWRAAAAVARAVRLCSRPPMDTSTPRAASRYPISAGPMTFCSSSPAATPASPRRCRFGVVRESPAHW